MSDLFNTLPDGCYHHKSYLGIVEQTGLVKLCREHLRDFPLMQPITKSGYPLALQVSSWGKVGWFGRQGSYEYMPRHINGREFPPVPKVIKNYVQEALILAKMPMINIDTVLLNWYPRGNGKLGRHQDVTEQDLKSPIVTISLGDTCLFNIGSEVYDEKGVDLHLLSGDVFVMGGKSRLAYHEVVHLMPTENSILPSGGRISLTARQVFV